MDEQKRQANLEKHDVDFISAYQLWQSTMIVLEDDRFDYGERRWIGIGKLQSRVMVVVYTQRGKIIRLISYRKANKRETIHYEQEIKTYIKNNKDESLYR